jgi:hypothetical protein
MTTYSEILKAAMALPSHERGSLAEELWESVDDEPANREPLLAALRELHQDGQKLGE